MTAELSLATGAELRKRFEARRRLADDATLANLLDAGTDVVAALTGIVDTGAPGPVAFGTEAGLFHDRLGVPCVVVGPGDIADAHRPDESIDPHQLVRCADVLHRTIDRFCA